MNQSGLYYIKTGSLILFIVILFGYSFFQVRNIILGPRIIITSPLPGQTYTHALVTVSGTAKNVNYLTLNDKQIYTDTDGNFTEKILIAPGLNTIKIYAENKFGKKTKTMLQIIMQSDGTQVPHIPAENSIKTATSTGNVIPSASSTPSQ